MIILSENFKSSFGKKGQTAAVWAIEQKFFWQDHSIRIAQNHFCMYSKIPTKRPGHSRLLEFEKNTDCLIETVSK